MSHRTRDLLIGDLGAHRDLPDDPVAEPGATTWKPAVPNAKRMVTTVQRRQRTRWKTRTPLTRIGAPPSGVACQVIVTDRRTQGRRDRGIAGIGTEAVIPATGRWMIRPVHPYHIKNDRVLGTGVKVTGGIQ